MRKFLAISMFLIIALMLTACNDSMNEESALEVKNNEDSFKPSKEILVAYFSCTGKTKNLAEVAANVLNADIFEIKPKVPYTAEDLDTHNDNSRSTVEMKYDVKIRPEIVEKVPGFKYYKTIVLAYPIWWNDAPRIIDTFIESYDFSDKTVIPICTSGKSDIVTSENFLKTLTPNSTKWIDGKRFDVKDSPEEIKTWLESKIPQ